MTKKYVSLLLFLVYAFGCKSPEKMPETTKELPVEFQPISDAEKQKIIERQIKSERDSVVRLFSGLKTADEKQKQYSNTNLFRDKVVDYMRKASFRTNLTMNVNGSIGSGYRKIYFPPLKESSFYPPETIIVCENLDPETKMNLNYEVMIRTTKGWEFYVFGHDLELTTNAAYYQYPADCVTCHYDQKIIEPMYSFSQYFNRQHPITKQKIEFDGFLSREGLESLTTNKNTMGLFGPYRELMKGAR